MLHLGLCHIRGYVVWYHVVRDYVAFGLGVMSFGIMSHSTLCSIWTYIVGDCVVRHNVFKLNVIRGNVV